MKGGKKNRRAKINVTISAWWNEKVKFFAVVYESKYVENVARMEINTRKMLQMKGKEIKRRILAYLY